MTMNVDDQMLVCLEIMCRGEDMVAVGTWEAPIKRLAMREFATQIGNGYRVTDAGRAFFAKSEDVDLETVRALEPPRPDWIVTVLPGDGGLVILRKNELTVSGYEAMRVSWVPVVHGRMNEPDTVAVRGDVAGFLKAVAEAANNNA